MSNACKTSFLVHSKGSDINKVQDPAEDGIWYIDPKNVTNYALNTGDQVPITPFQCNFRMTSLLFDFSCSDLCHQSGSNLTVKFECCNEGPCGNLDTAKLQLSTNVSMSYALATELIKGKNARLTFEETVRGSSGKVKSSETGIRDAFEPYERCDGENKRIMEVQRLQCFATGGTSCGPY